MRVMTTHSYYFGPYRLDAAKRVLFKEQDHIPLTPKAFDTLLALVESNGQLVAKNELINRVWPDSFVEEGNLTVTISMLRKALGETPNQHRYIVTVPGRGYRFVASVRELRAEPEDQVIQEQTRASIVIQREESESVVEVTRAASLRVLLGLGLRYKLLALLLGASVLAAAIYLLLVSRNARPEPTIAARQTVAVLPFKLINLKPEQEYLAFGLADMLITRLSNVRQIIVRPMSASRRYKEPDQDPLAAARELKVDYAIQGSMQQQGDRIRITAQLIDVKTGLSVWAEKFDQAMTDMFAVQDSISEHVARAFAIKLESADREMLSRRYTESPEAYDLYTKGRYFWDKRSASNLQKSVEYFKEALAKDPSYALAYAGLADSYALLATGGGEYSMQPADAITNAREAVTRALELDNSLADAHTSLAIIHLNYDWDWENSEREFKRALELNPGSSNAHYWYSLYLCAMARSDEAIAESRLAADIEPLSPLIAAQVVRALNYAGHFDEAVAESQRALELDPNRAVARYMLAEAYVGLGQFDAAIVEYKKVVPFDHDPYIVKSAVAVATALAGDPGQARQIVGELLEKAKREYVTPYYFIDLYSSMGDMDSAFEWVEKAYQEHAGFLAYSKVDSVLTRLNRDPRYHLLLKRLRLSP